MLEWVAPEYEISEPTSDTIPAYMRYFSVIAVYYITQELDIAVNATKMYFSL